MDGLWVGGRGGTWVLEGGSGDEGLGQMKCGTGRVGVKACVGVWVRVMVRLGRGAGGGELYMMMNIEVGLCGVFG